jgi:hypothetical protein
MPAAIRGKGIEKNESSKHHKAERSYSSCQLSILCLLVHLARSLQADLQAERGRRKA